MTSDYLLTYSAVAFLVGVVGAIVFDPARFVLGSDPRVFVSC